MFVKIFLPKLNMAEPTDLSILPRFLTPDFNIAPIGLSMPLIPPTISLSVPLRAPLSKSPIFPIPLPNNWKAPLSSKKVR